MIKQVIVMRKDLNMRKGKMVAQGCHASLQSYTQALSLNPRETIAWFSELSTKICVSVDSEEMLLNIWNQAIGRELPCAIIRDAGLTEFKEPTLTCCAIGPASSEEIDKITGALSLL